MRIFYSTPLKRYNRALNSPQSSQDAFATFFHNWNDAKNRCLGSLIRPLASIIWQLSRCRGIRVTLENAPASPNPAYLATRSHITLPRHSGRAQSNHDGTHRRLFWPPYLSHLMDSTDQTFKTSPSTFNVNGDSPRIAIAAPVFSVFHIVSLTRETTKSGSATTLTACHSSNTASATATLPPTPCDCITEAFLTDSGWLVRVFLSKVLMFHS